MSLDEGTGRRLRAIRVGLGLGFPIVHQSPIRPADVRPPGREEGTGVPNEIPEREEGPTDLLVACMKAGKGDGGAEELEETKPA
jgi:hypothetical protein